MPYFFGIFNSFLIGHALGAVRRAKSMTRLSGFARRTAFNSFQHFQHFQQVFNIKLHKDFCAYCYTFNISTSFQQSFQLRIFLIFHVITRNYYCFQLFHSPYYYYYNKLYIIDYVCKCACVRVSRVRARERN